MFENFIEASKEQDKKIEYKKINLSSNIFFNPNLVVDILENIDKYSDQEIFDVIKESYATIYSERFIAQDQRRVQLIANPRFIAETIKVFSIFQDIQYSTLVFMNKIIYDFIHKYTSEEYEDQRNLFINLARAINKRKIQELLMIGLSEPIAVNCIFRRYSSNNESVNIKRLIHYMGTIEPETMNTQMIVYIYERLFDELGLLFQIIMTEPISNGNYEETYENIGMAILAMVDGMPTVALQRVIRGYGIALDSGALGFGKTNIYVRYSLTSEAMSGYARIMDTAIYLRDCENIKSL